VLLKFLLFVVPRFSLIYVCPLHPPFLDAATYEKGSYFIYTLLIYLLEGIYILYTISY